MRNAQSTINPSQTQERIERKTAKRDQQVTVRNLSLNHNKTVFWRSWITGIRRGNHQSKSVGSISCQAAFKDLQCWLVPRPGATQRRDNSPRIHQVSGLIGVRTATPVDHQGIRGAHNTITTCGHQWTQKSVPSIVTTKREGNSVNATS